LAAVGEEEIEELFGRVDVERVKDATALAAVGDEAGVDEFLEMERERGRGELELFGDLSGGEAGLSLAGEETEHAEAGLMREGGERLDDLPFFHISTIVEMSNGGRSRADSIEAGGDGQRLMRKSGNGPMTAWCGWRDRPRTEES
jgi:hypothetical protein